jgi:hypothetical protein
VYRFLKFDCSYKCGLSLLIINIKTFAFKKAGEHEWLVASLGVKLLAETKGPIRKHNIRKVALRQL